MHDPDILIAETLRLPAQQPCETAVYLAGDHHAGASRRGKSKGSETGPHLDHGIGGTQPGTVHDGGDDIRIQEKVLAVPFLEGKIMLLQDADDS